MATHFYKFARSKTGSLVFQGKYKIEYFEENLGWILFKDTEIKVVKDVFNIGRYRTVMSGGVWLKNHLKNKK